MPALPRLRLVGYAVVIVALVSLLAFGQNGILSGVSLKRIKIFQAPREDSVAPLQQAEIAADPSGDSDRKPEAAEAEKDFDFNAAMNQLSTNDNSGMLGESPRTVNPPVVPTPAIIPLADLNRSQGEKEDVNDGRQAFAGLVTDEGDAAASQGFLGGVSVRSNSLGAGIGMLTPQATPQSGRDWMSGQARGYTMLYAMQPEARQVVEVNVQTLLAARIREPYIGVLIDGTFGRDFTYLKNIITRLSSEGRALTLVLYLSNGPTMRQWRTTPIDALFSRIDPEELRQRIRRDQLLRNQFSAVAVQARDIFSYNLSQGPDNSNVAIVMLEDNLDVAAYRAMRDLAKEQLEGIAGFARNPCMGCYDGNDDATLGNPREEHGMERFSILQRGDGFSLDGTGFRYPNGGSSGISSAELSALMVTSYQRGLRYVGLWRHEWQGVGESADNSHPEERIFEASTPDQQEFEIQTLRTGLVAESSEDLNS